MSKLKKLIKRATEAAERRGHQLSWEFHLPHQGARTALGKCVKCKTEPDFADYECSQCADPPVTGWVLVKTHPLPNEIDIGGPAVALNCPFTDEQTLARDAVNALIGCCAHNEHSFYGCLTGGCDCREDRAHA